MQTLSVVAVLLAGFLLIFATVGIPYAVARWLLRMPKPDTGIWIGNVAKYATLVGVTGFVLGFFGPMITQPDANQGPLLGILILGPAGALAGAFIGSAMAFWPHAKRPISPDKGNT